MDTQKYKKIIIIEPNLKNTTGHVYESTKAMEKYLLSKNIKHYIISHKNITTLTRNSFTQVFPYADVSCFETSNYLLVVKYLNKILKKLKITKNDLIIFPTAHLNELKAVAKISNSNKQTPKFILQLHQFYPPLNDSNKITTKKINSFLNNEFKKVFHTINFSKVKIATTNVNAFNKKLSKLSPHKLNLFPVPFIFPKLKNNSKKITIGFLGDGRKEKGLLNFLESVPLIIKKYKRINIIIQIHNPRCFTKKEMARIKKITHQIKQLQQIKIIDNALDSKNYYKYLLRCSAIIIPYDPSHYKIRLSGISIECGALKIPVIATKQTWTDAMIKAKKISGISFSFSKNQQDFTKNILKALAHFLKHQKKYKKIAVKSSQYFINNYSAKEYFENYIFKTL